MKLTKYIFLGFLFVGMLSCGDYLDINVDPNQPDKPGDLDLLMADATATTSYNLVGGGNWTRYAAQWVQHIADNSTPPTVATYRFNTSSCNNEWSFYSYAGVLINCKKMIDIGTENGQWHHVGIAQILMAHNYALLTDWWGDIPFSEALAREGNSTPIFDDQATVYDGVQLLLDEGIANLQKDSPISVGDGDLYLGGDVAAWRKVANSLKARYYLRLSNAPGHDEMTQANLALSVIQKGMASTADEARFDYQNTPGAEAPMNQWVGKFATSMQVSTYMVEKLEGLNDPRLPVFADQNQDGVYLGFTSGLATTNTLAEISAIGAYYMDADFDVPLMTYIEQLFIEAEAHWRLGQTTEAEAAYEAAIRAHMSELSGQGEFGTVIGEAAQDAYLMNNPLTGLEDIMTQKYLAGFLTGSFEAYNDYRRTGFPSDLMPAPNGDVAEIPTRMIYTDTEINNNVANVPTGITPTSRVWWDN